jgi:hypothetical protein
MPLTATDLIETVGAANANSFVTLAEANAFHVLNFGSDAWFGTTEDTVSSQVRALVKAARRLNQENWLGSRTNTLGVRQALAWPRIGVPKIDGETGGWGYSCPDVYFSFEIPQQIKDAQCLLALAYLDGFADGEGQTKAEFWAGSVRISDEKVRSDDLLPAEVVRLISPLNQWTVLVRS